MPGPQGLVPAFPFLENTLPFIHSHLLFSVFIFQQETLNMFTPSLLARIGGTSWKQALSSPSLSEAPSTQDTSGHFGPTRGWWQAQL